MDSDTTEKEQWNRLFNAVNTAIAYLLQADVSQFESALWRSMGVLADAVDADRVRLWRNFRKEGKLYCTQIYEWSEGAVPSQGTPITIEVPYDENLSGWEEKLTRNECINSIVHTMLPKEVERFSSQGILSILIVPVFLRNEFWGFVGFNDCHRERLFTSNEEAILRSASLLITNALLRNEMTQQITATMEKAFAASQAKSQFLSNMSHEIRTPLNAIVGMTTIGKSAQDIEKKDYAFEKIETASTHLLGVINDVLDVSKIEANKFDLSNVVFNFEKMIKKVVSVILFRVNEKKQTLKLSLDPNIPEMLLGDDQRLAQVITNLLSNATKFTPESGSILLHVRLLDIKDTFCKLQVAVTDTGIGISQEQQRLLFMPFKQAENDTSRKFGGTGLGLAISKRIVELMNGDIWIESSLGTGATFTFSIELGRTAYDKRPLVNIESTEKIQMLAVDDDPEILEFFKIVAQRMNLTCDTAADHQEALKLLNRQRYDICFIDLRVPTMDGITLSRAITDTQAKKPTLIIISAHDWNPVEQAAKSAGVDDFLQKPLFISDVVECINNHVGTQKKNGNSAEQRRTESFQGRRILFAEDMEINREIVLTLLEPTQIEIDCAADGAEAVKLFNAAPARYDIIFMDIQMPGMDGVEATRHIRMSGSAKAETIPIIAITANVFREEVELYLESGMNDHIGKPFDHSELLAKLKQYLP